MRSDNARDRDRAGWVGGHGGKETEEFHRQSDMYVEAFATAERKIERYSVPDCDHFDELNALANPDHDFFKKSHALITA